MSDNFKKLGSILTSSILAKVGLPVILVVVAILGFLVIIVASILGSDMGGGGKIDGGGKELSEQVLRWEDQIQDALDEHGLDDKYMPVLLAILQQESGGDALATTGDIFQASESKCGEIGCINDPNESIDQAVKHFKNNVEAANGNQEVAIASYNFGNGFAQWTQKNHDNEWSIDIAIEFSQHMMEKVENPDNYTCLRQEAKKHDACYGDILYVSTIKQYLPGSDRDSSDVNFAGDLNNPLNSVVVTSNFGYRVSPGDGVGSTDHKGIDFDCVGGTTPILAAGDGQVVVSENNSGGYGKMVIIKHDVGFYTHYAHMSALSVDKNDFVKSGDKLGVCGSTGDSTGAHLHFETKSELWGGQQNPRDFLDLPPSIF